MNDLELNLLVLTLTPNILLLSNCLTLTLNVSVLLHAGK